MQASFFNVHKAKFKPALLRLELTLYRRSSVNTYLKEYNCEQNDMKQKKSFFKNEMWTWKYNFYKNQTFIND